MHIYARKSNFFVSGAQDNRETSLERVTDISTIVVDRRLDRRQRAVALSSQLFFCFCCCFCYYYFYFCCRCTVHRSVGGRKEGRKEGRLCRDRV
jgi:hypothetical protein